VGIGTQSPLAGMDVEAPSTTAIGVLGTISSQGSGSIGVYGRAINSVGATQGVAGVSDSPNGIGVHGIGSGDRRGV
jgi:hypothetical protein